MARLDLAYARSLWRVAEPGDLARVVWRRVGDKLSRGAAPARIDDEAVRLAADALGRAPRVFAAESLGELYRAHFPEALARYRARAQRILDGEAEIFGVWRKPELDHADPKLAWEAGRAAHLGGPWLRRPSRPGAFEKGKFPCECEPEQLSAAAAPCCRWWLYAPWP